MHTLFVVGAMQWPATDGAQAPACMVHGHCLRHAMQPCAADTFGLRLLSSDRAKQLNQATPSDLSDTATQGSAAWSCMDCTEAVMATSFAPCCWPHLTMLVQLLLGHAIYVCRAELHRQA